LGFRRIPKRPYEGQKGVRNLKGESTAGVCERGNLGIVEQCIRGEIGVITRELGGAKEKRNTAKGVPGVAKKKKVGKLPSEGNGVRKLGRVGKSLKEVDLKMSPRGEGGTKKRGKLRGGLGRGKKKPRKKPKPLNPQKGNSNQRRIEMVVKTTEKDTSRSAPGHLGGRLSR